MPELQEYDRREWTPQEIARAQLTEPLSPLAYTSPAGPYIVELYARWPIRDVECEIDSYLPRFPPDGDELP